jgi:hypothetical protein
MSLLRIHSSNQSVLLHSCNEILPIPPCSMQPSIPLTQCKKFFTHIISHIIPLDTSSQWIIHTPPFNWNQYHILFDSDYRCRLPITVGCTWVIQRFSLIYVVFVISCPWFRPPDISRDNVSDVQTGDAIRCISQPSALSRWRHGSDHELTPASFVFKSIFINCNASRLLSYLSWRIR